VFSIQPSESRRGSNLTTYNQVLGLGSLIFEANAIIPFQTGLASRLLEEKSINNYKGPNELIAASMVHFTSRVMRPGGFDNFSDLTKAMIPVPTLRLLRQSMPVVASLTE
jgi:hypothetical protein